ncbi:ribonuclease H-like protein [Wilcoxina mikolae CBS 423.85]|nr:ribonuclease H-like protein [Wilcoxina mikolae CBS 423.85]
MKRVFRTAYCDPDDPPEDPENATYYDDDAELTFITKTNYNYLEKQPEMLCISVDGACSNNGYSNARASAGVFFGPHSRYNWSGVLDHNTHSQTNQCAEIFAMIRALRIFNQNRHEDHWDEISTIVIVTDSDYVFQGITCYVEKWRRNGYQNFKGEALVNRDKFRQLNTLVEDLEDDGIDVLFWRVNREFNQEADELAKSEL